MSQSRVLAIVFIVVGALLALVSAFADFIGLGAPGSSFGWKQLLGTVLGIIALVAGIVLLRQPDEYEDEEYEGEDDEEGVVAEEGAVADEGMVAEGATATPALAAAEAGDGAEVPAEEATVASAPTTAEAPDGAEVPAGESVTAEELADHGAAAETERRAEGQDRRP
jgi:hypothetical protein